MTGLRNRSAEVSVSPHISRSAGASVRNSATSPPALKALPPAPRTITTRTASSASSEAKMPGNSLRIATVIVFIFGWRSIHSVATGPRRSTRRNSLTCLVLPRAAPRESWCDLGVAAVPEQAAQDLARCGLGNLAHEDDAPRALERGEIGRGQTERVERPEREPRALRDDEGDDTLAQPLVGLAHHRHVANVGMARQHVLDLDRMDVLAAADDHVVHPSGHVQLTLGIEPTHVAREI